MSKLYVVIKVGTQVPELRGDTENTAVQCEASFLDKTKAEAFYAAIQTKGSKREIIEGVVYDITRALHEVDIIE
jgi:hypothetical protein